MRVLAIASVLIVAGCTRTAQDDPPQASVASTPASKSTVASEHTVATDPQPKTIVNHTRADVAADAEAQTLVADALSLKVKCGKHWDVTFSGDEIRTMTRLLASAKPYNYDGIILYAVSNNGVLKTKQHTYNIQIGLLKDTSVLFVLRDAERWNSTKMYRLTDDDGRTFMKSFYTALDSKMGKLKPDGIVVD